MYWLTNIYSDNNNKGKEKIASESGTSTKIQWKPVKNNSKFKSLNEKSVKKENVYTSHKNPELSAQQVTKG